MYYPSKYNHLVEIEPRPGRRAWVISNLLFGASTLANEAIYRAFLDGERDGRMPDDVLSPDAWAHFLDRGFVWARPEAEEELIRNARHTLARDQLAEGTQGGHYGFITSLYCNLACPYCFQKVKADSCGFLTPAQVDLGLAAIARCEEQVTDLNQGAAGVPKISITGGEPLLRSRRNLEVVDYLLARLAERRWPCSITTNGTDLAEFVADHPPLPNCRNIQVTLDGPRAVHDRRRCFRDGSPSFDPICEGLAAALAAGWHMTLRVNLDMDNVEHLPALAEYVQAQGWPDYSTFSAYVSPVTDHGSLGGFDVPADEADLLLALLAVVDRAPVVRRVFDIRHFRGFNYVERMVLHNDPKYPVIYRCEAVMGMYIFDPRGDIHVCLEAVGDPALRVGTYDPEWRLDDAAEARWMQRNVLALRECDDCKIRFICAGGCTMESFNRGGKAACMPFRREMDIAWQYYARTRPDLFE
jgi:uncharacterized protein